MTSSQATVLQGIIGLKARPATVCKTKSRANQILLVLTDLAVDWESEEHLAWVSSFSDEAGSPILTIRRSPSEGKVAFLRRLVRHLPYVRQVVFRPSYAGSWHQRVGLPLAIARFFGAAVTLDLRSPSFGSVDLTEKYLILKLMAQASNILVTNEESSTALRACGLNSEVVLSKISTEDFCGTDIQKVAPHILVPLYSTDLTNLIALIKAFGLIKSKYPRARMQAIAWGDIADQISSLCQIEKITGIRTVDAADSTAVRASLAQFDVILNASLGSDAMGLIRRAARFGIPVVSVETKWTRRMLFDHKAALAVDGDRPGEIATVVNRLVENPSLVADLIGRNRRSNG